MEDNNLNKERARLSDGVIRNHMIWAMGAGFIPIPVADFIAIGAIQLDMVRQMCKVYGLDFKESEGKAIVSALTSSGLAKLGARAILKVIPGFGSILGGVALAMFSGASTFALGEVFKRHFENGGTILDFDVNRLKNMYDEKFEKGKEVARRIKADQEAGRTTKIKVDDAPEEIFDVGAVEEEAQDIVKQLKDLQVLCDTGVITEEEFKDLKAKLIADF